MDFDLAISNGALWFLLWYFSRVDSERRENSGAANAEFDGLRIRGPAHWFPCTCIQPKALREGVTSRTGIYAELEQTSLGYWIRRQGKQKKNGEYTLHGGNSLGCSLPVVALFSPFGTASRKRRFHKLPAISTKQLERTPF
ncbi:hypothetical protein IW261DRAFT_1422453 [Armillaria novae-zelandiae]|uniref:Uncharacterized protein n=1 Tax=Armillaria novae-zelandiae TaxID=153914 RepID=A0AA39P062_9AGAR|nr:hypothetical protein IW261DRAFT_1422453 [Armillaria novae-zelandiae]